MVALDGGSRHHASSAGEDEEAERIRRLIVRARAGDREALGELYAVYSESVFRCVQRILGDAHEAEDVTQQVFLKLMSVLPRYERREVPFSAWLMRVARNAALDAERKRRPIRWRDVPDPDPQDDERHERSLSLRDALATLPAAQRRVVVLRHVVGLSATEIGERLGKTTGSIHALDQRGRRALQDELIEHGSAPATLGRSRLSGV